ncbi:MAG: thymidine kinase [Propionibacteriaceae bacterium]
MAELLFFTGPMDCGKSTLALQVDHTQSIGGRSGRLFTCFDRRGESVVTSRIGLSRPAVHVESDFDFWNYVVRQLTTGNRLDYLVCDEAQFYAPEQIDQLARIVDELQLDVFAFGILSDFRTTLFPGSQRLVELADRIESLPVQPLCWCGKHGTHNARTINGTMVTTGDQVVVGDTGDSNESTPADVRYEVLCRQHHRRKITAAIAKATMSPDPLPFGDWEEDEIEPYEAVGSHIQDLISDEEYFED